MEDKLYKIYILNSTLTQIIEDFKKYADNNSEAIGFLCGTVKQWKKQEYIIINEYVTAENDSNEIRAKFSREAFKLLAKELKNKLIIGWAHSHPSYGCFLSKTDINTHKELFPEEYQVALVIDPLKDQKQVETRFFKVVENNYSEIAYAVIE